MLRLIIFLIISYFVFKIAKSFFIPRKENEQVKGKAKQQSKRKINDKQIEDADYEELNE